MHRRLPPRCAAALLALCLAACQPPGSPGPTAGGSQCRLSLAASLPLNLSPSGSRLLIPVTASGAKMIFLIDTGSEVVALNEQSASRLGGGHGVLGEPLERNGFASGIGGARSVVYREDVPLALGRLHGSFLVQVINTDFSEKRQHVDGLLSMSVLGDFDVDFDLPDHQLRLYSAAGRCDTPAVLLDQPIYAAPMGVGFHSELREIIPVTINGQDFRALLDTGSPNILLFRSAGAKLGLPAAGAPGSHTVGIGGVGGASSAALARLDRLAIGPLTLRNIPVGVAAEDNGEADLLLGLPLLKIVHVWLSNSSHTLIMQYPPQHSPPLPVP